MADLFGKDVSKDFLGGINSFFGGIGAGIASGAKGFANVLGQQASPYSVKVPTPLEARTSADAYAARQKAVANQQQQINKLGGTKNLSNLVAKELKAQKDAGSGSGAGGSGSGISSPKTSANAPASLSSLLNVDPSGVYKPALDFLEQQRKFAQSRYESNAANLKNIFGALTGLAAADQARIKEQFTQSITASQTALAERMAAENAATAEGVAQAQETGAERGMGPGMAVNPIQSAMAEGQSQANAAATVWEGLQRANESQALEDTRTRQAGYGYQEVAATQALQDALNERLMGLEGSKAGVLGDLAQAKFGVQQNVAQAKYQEAVAARNAAASAAAAAARAASNIPAVDKVRNSIGSQRFNALTNQLNSAYARALAGKNPIDPVTGKQGKMQMPNASDVLAEWINVGGNRDLINEATTIAKNIYNK
jgi:uncharacterized protein YoaH (UPF0181 family)